MIFTEESTQLISGGSDTYILIYDLVTSTASYKLMGHTEPITQLQTIVTPHPTRGNAQKSLFSGSSDGLIKVWDLQRQLCIGSYGDSQMAKVTDFVLIASLSVLVVGSSDRMLRLFQVKVNGAEKIDSSKVNESGEIGDVQLELRGSIMKDSSARSLQLIFDNKRSLLTVLSSDNKLEILKVINSDKPDSILKKLVKLEKKAQLKRTHQ